MLSSNTQMTPRPRPPAKMRRSSSQTRPADLHSRNAAPPPYVPFPSDPMPTLLGSPITATSRLIRLEEVCEKEENLHEKSKEELEALLKRASDIIRERERELDLTSETCRTLAENNTSLKTRNDSLIARLPPSGPTSPLASPSFHSGPLLSPAHSRSSSRTILLSPKLLSTQSSIRRRPGHVRRISSTPGELAALADQNAELLAKLADLEAEASHTEQAGKRRLKSLEAEIETLRDELERARDESKQLQETMQSAPPVALEGLPKGLDKQVVKMFKRLSREAKVRELKAKSRPWEQNEKLEEPKDFAPNNLTPGLPFTSKIVSRKVSAPNLRINTSIDQRSDGKSKAASPTLPQVGSPLSTVPPSATSTVAPNAREQALVSQLLLKIRELEETNAQLAANHLQASIRLREAQTESESVRRLCEFISDEVEGDLDLELEVVRDDEDENKEHQQGEQEEVQDNDLADLRAENRKMFRLKSVSKKASMDFGRGSMRHSVRLRKFRSMDSLPPLQSSPPASVRVGVGAGAGGRNIGIGDRRPKTRKTVLGLFQESSSVESSMLPSTPSFDHSLDSRLSSVQEPLGTPNTDTDIAADGDIDTDNDTEPPSLMPSLGSELGLELEGLRPAPGMGHVRTKSIMELLRSHDADTPDASAQASPVSVLSPRPRLDSLRGTARVAKAGEDGDGGHFPAAPLDDRILYPRLRKARSSAVVGASASSPLASSAPRVSNRPDDTNHHSSHRRSSLPSPRLPSAGTPGPEPNSAPSPSPKTNFAKLRALLLELWLWLYFVAVIVVFIFSMARKGPKVVLNNNKNNLKKPISASSAAAAGLGRKGTM